MQANFGWSLLEHTLNPALVGSPEGPWPEAEQASRPQGTGGHGGRIWGAKWVLGKRMAYQVPGRALGEVGVRHSSASLGFGLAARQGSQVGLLAPLALQGGSDRGASCSAQLASQLPKSQREASSLAGSKGARPQGCAGRTCWIMPGWLQTPSPSLLAPKAVEGWSNAGPAAPTESRILLPPLSFTPAKLHGPMARRAWGWCAPLPIGSAALGLRSASGCCDPARLGSWEAGATQARRMALTAQWVTSTGLLSAPVCQRGRRVPQRPAGEPRLRDSALSPHLLSGKCLITVHS